MKDEAGAEARTLLLAAFQGVLSTHSQDMPGYPFGSVAPYCLDGEGRPLFLISELAQHTKNLRADPRCSFIVVARGEDIQANARLTLVGEGEPLQDGKDIEAAADRYYRYFPDSRDFHRIHDFRFFRLVPRRCRFIGGFGRIHWLGPEAILRPNPFAGSREADIVEHMNADHAEALVHYCGQAGIETGARAPVLAGIDGEGIHLRLGDRIARIGFSGPVATPMQAREVLVAMARSGREAPDPSV
jgi:putative heme iron utilization protein